MIHELEGVLEVILVHVDAHPKAVLVLEEVGEEAEDEAVDAELLGATLDRQIRHVARLEQFSDPRQQEGLVVRPGHRRQHGGGEVAKFGWKKCQVLLCSSLLMSAWPQLSCESAPARQAKPNVNLNKN